MKALFDCIVSAAGASSRMSDLKPLLPFRGRAMVETVVDAALGSGCRVLLVVGHRAPDVARPFAARAERGDGRLLLVENPRWELGLLGSIQAALPLVRGEAFYSMHADMPFVESGIYGLLASARESARAEEREAAFFAAHRGEEGHPVLIPSAWIPAILELDPGERMKDFLDARPSVLVEAGEEAVLLDIDTPEDYARLVAQSRMK